jgi:heme exporter protein C
MPATGARTLALLTAALLAVGFGMAFLWTPLDADQGFIQKIFYLHVPMALVALGGFIVGGVWAVRHLRSGDPLCDLRAYVSIHISVILGVGVLITGMIWAKASWGAWWVWEEPTLVAFLLVFLLYATYYPLRYSIEDRDRQARYASVFAVVGGVFVPLSFTMVRMADPLIHPRTFATTGGGMPGEMMLTFLVCLAAMAALWATLVRFEVAAKLTAGRARRLRRRLEDRLDLPPASAPAGSRIAPGTGR